MLHLLKKILRDHCRCTDKYRGAEHSICNLRFKGPDEIYAVFQNGTNYDYYFIIKELANKFEEKSESLGENTEKYKTFSVPLKKEVTNIDKDGNESVAIMLYLTNQNLLIVQYLWQVHYQIL